MNKVINSKKAPAAVGPYVHSVEIPLEHKGLLITSGQIGLIPETAEMAEGIVEQTKQVLKNLEAVLGEAGYFKEDVVKTTVFIDNMDDFATVNEIYGEFFGECKPARSCVEVSKLPKGALVEIEVIASK